MSSIDEHAPQIRFWCQMLLLAALLAKCAQAAIFGLPVALGFVLDNSSLERVLVQWGMPLVNGGLFLFFAGWLPTSRRTIWLLIAAGVITAAALLSFGEDNYLWQGSHLLAGLPLGYWLLVKAGHEGWRARAAGVPAPSWIPLFFWLVLGLFSLGIATGTMLRISGVIFPVVWDLHLLKLEAAYGDFAIAAANWHLAGPQWLQSGTRFIYALLGGLFLPLLAWLHRENKAFSLHAWRFVLVPFFVAWICYSWLPAVGPIYVYPTGFPNGVPAAQEVIAGLVAVDSVPRNAMPSMHLSGAILVLMVAAALRRKWVFGAAIGFVLATAWATLALGEHYVIDLVVAMVFAPALGLWLMAAPRWQTAPRWAHLLQWAAAASFVIWMLLLRLAPEWLQSHLLFVQLFSLWSALAGLSLLVLHVRSVWAERDTSPQSLQAGAPSVTPLPRPASTLLPVELAGNRWLVGIFFFSGFAGLVYEVVYAKALGVTFGGTALAANTVLMTYMGGMAVGAWLGGMLAERSRNPLLLYALFEAAIGLYAIVTPFLFEGIQALYVAVALDSPADSSALSALRMTLGAGVLGVPTVLMGATLPLVFQCLRGMGIPTARAIAPLYAANVLGAAVGALVAGYALLPAIGRNGGTLLAAVISLLVALFVIDKLKRGAASLVPIAPEGESGSAVTESAFKPVAARLGLAGLVVLTVGGVITLALEVVFMHLLAVVAGNSVYAFGLMLATFLLGLGLGSMVGERWMRLHGRTTLVLWAQCGIALVILLTSFIWDGLADYMGSFGYAQQQGIFLSFSARELIRALVCALAMLPPAFFIGMSYPAAMGLAADWLAGARFAGSTTRGVGLASALNTVGNIAGVLLAAFWWLPSYGSRDVLLGLAVAAIALAALMAWAGSPASRHAHWRQWLPVACVAAALMLFPAQWNFTALSQGGNVYFASQQWGTVIDHAESVEGGLTTVARSGKSHLTLLTNGKFQGNNAEGGEMVAQESIALIPLLHTAGRGQALVIGYGTGMTARVLQDQGFEHLDVVELSRDIVEMADKYFANINAHISRHPAVAMHYTDGRNYLLTQSRKYDLISLEISSIWFAGAANLYNREFYQLATQRLQPRGVLQQWVQLHHMRSIDFLYIMSSVRSEFRYVWVYVSGGQGIIVASNDPAAAANQQAQDTLMASHTISALELPQLPETLVATPAQVDAMIERFDPSRQIFISTDKNLYLEYATPKGNALREDTASILIDMLQGKL